VASRVLVCIICELHVHGVACCVLRVACCVLRVACCVLRVACCVLRVAGVMYMQARETRSDAYAL
jgi:hypothetical protein